MTPEPVLQALENIAHAAKSSSDPKTLREAVKAARSAAQSSLGKNGNASSELLAILEQELSTWESKLDVILKEPVGRQGMAKHAHYWIEKLKKAGA